MKQSILIYVLSVFFLYTACEKKETPPQGVETVFVTTIDTMSIPKSTQGLKPSLRLTSKAQEAVKDWSLYQSLAKKLDSLDGITLGETKNKLSFLISIFDDQEESEKDIVGPTPDTMEKPAIKARLLAIETKLKIVNNYVQKREPSAEEISAGIVALKNAFQNLNLQINENFGLTIKEILKQFDKETGETIYTPESEKVTPRK